MSSPIYETQMEAYQAEFGAYIRRIRHLGPVSLIDLAQTAGDFSDPPSGDLQIMRIQSRAQVHTDLSAGKFSAWWSPGMLGISPANFGNSILVDQSHRVEAMMVSMGSLRSIDVEGKLPIDGNFGSAHRKAHEDAAMYALIDRLWGLDPDIDSLAIESALAWIGARVVSWMHAAPGTDVAPKERLSPFHLRLARDRLRTPGSDRVTLTEIATACGYSPFHFCRAFKASTGLSPSRYQTMCRIEHAKDMLRGSKMAIADISVFAGFDDPSYFARVFTREAGWSPARWRREYRQLAPR